MVPGTVRLAPIAADVIELYDATAEEHGITNWEENPAAYTAIGEGLRSAGVSDAELMAYKRNLSGGDPRKADLIQQGYDSAR